MSSNVVKAIHVVERPTGNVGPPKPGDVVEIELVSGFVCAMDPVTRQSTKEPKRFILQDRL